MRIIICIIGLISLMSDSVNAQNNKESRNIFFHNIGISAGKSGIPINLWSVYDNYPLPTNDSLYVIETGQKVPKLKGGRYWKYDVVNDIHLSYAFTIKRFLIGTRLTYQKLNYFGDVYQIHFNLGYEIITKERQKFDISLGCRGTYKSNLSKWPYLLLNFHHKFLRNLEWTGSIMLWDLRYQSGYDWRGTPEYSRQTMITFLVGMNYIFNKKD
jgi:hypothetical protein